MGVTIVTNNNKVIRTSVLSSVSSGLFAFSIDYVWIPSGRFYTKFKSIMVSSLIYWHTFHSLEAQTLSLACKTTSFDPPHIQYTHAYIQPLSTTSVDSVKSTSSRKFKRHRIISRTSQVVREPFGFRHPCAFHKVLSFLGSSFNLYKLSDKRLNMYT